MRKQGKNQPKYDQIQGQNEGIESFLRCLKDSSVKRPTSPAEDVHSVMKSQSS